MTKLQRILAGVLIAQLILAVVLLWPRPATSGAGKSLLEGLKAEDVSSLTVSDDTGVTTRLAKQGDEWVAPDAAGYAADATKITSAISKLVGIMISQPVARSAASHAQLQVADDKFVRKVELQTTQGTMTLFLGTSTGSRTTHVRLAGQSDVYLARDVATWEVNADLLSWVNPVYLSVPSADVTAFSLVNANGQFAFTKDAQGSWTLEGLAQGETLDAAKVTSLLAQVTSLRMTRPLGKTEEAAYGMAQPGAVVTIRSVTADQSATTTLTVGAKDPASTDNSYVVKSSASEYYVRVAEYSVKDLLEKTRDGFLQLPPTPTPSPGEK